VHGSPHYKRALAIWKKALGTGHPHTKPVKAQFGTALKPDFPERFLRPQPYRHSMFHSGIVGGYSQRIQVAGCGPNFP
jgi:hypothetical protein